MLSMVLMLSMCPDTSRALLYMFADRGWACMRAGFSLPAVDVDTITYYFPDALTFMHVLQGMGGGKGCASAPSVQCFLYC
jgi:hypothetical protein